MGKLKKAYAERTGVAVSLWITRHEQISCFSG